MEKFWSISALISFIFFITAWLVNIGFLFRLHIAWRSLLPQPSIPHDISPAVSVIIAARNEAENLKKYLQFILSQDYPNYEVVIVLDRCDDDSERVLNTLQKQYPQLHYLTISAIPEGWSPKKYVLTEGILAAKHEYILLTDADCKPEPEWIKEMTLGFLQGKEIVLGLSPYFEERGLLNAMIRYETLYSAWQYIGFAAMNVPYMGVGRNIAYTKSFFLQKRGFEAFKERLSGDDDLFVNANATTQNLAVITSAQSLVWSVPKQTWKSWFRQKLRHTSAGGYYSAKTKLLLTAFGFSFIGVYFWGMIAIISGITVWKVLVPFIIRMILNLQIFFHLEKKMYSKKMLYLYPILDIIFVFYSAVIVPMGMLIKPKWS